MVNKKEVNIILQKNIYDFQYSLTHSDRDYIFSINSPCDVYAVGIGTICILTDGIITAEICSKNVPQITHGDETHIKIFLDGTLGSSTEHYCSSEILNASEKYLKAFQKICQMPKCAEKIQQYCSARKDWWESPTYNFLKPAPTFDITKILKT